MAEYYRQSAFITSVLAGFAFTFAATLLVGAREHRAGVVGGLSRTRGLDRLSAGYSRDDIQRSSRRELPRAVQLGPGSSRSVHSDALNLISPRHPFSRC